MDDHTRAEILRMHHLEHLRIGTIANRLGIHHSTVTRVLTADGDDLTTVRKRSIDPYLPFLTDLMERHPDTKASRLFLMARERGYPCGPDHFRHEIATLRPRRQPEAFLRLSATPGEEAQVDWGHFGRVQIQGAGRKLYALLIVLSYSRAIHLRFFHDMETASFLSGHVSAFVAFGGVPRRLLYDNLKSAVISRSASAIQFNPQLLEFAGHYGFEPVPVGVRRGNEKGRVERSVRYVRDNFFAARDLKDLEDLNHQAAEWATGPAMERPWPDAREITVATALKREQESLRSLPDDHPEIESTKVVQVGKTPFLRFDRNDYSVPHEHVRKEVTVRATSTRVRVIVDDEVVAIHRRSYGRGRQVEDPEHTRRLRTEKRRAQRGASLQRLTRTVPVASDLLKRFTDRDGNLGVAVRELTRLLDLHGATVLARAIKQALEQDAPHPNSVRHLIEQGEKNSATPPARAIDLSRHPHLSALTVEMSEMERFDALLDDGDDEEDEA